MNSLNQQRGWFYIKNLSSGKVISADTSFSTMQTDEYARSRVIVTKQHYTESELWCWEDNYLKNKFTGLVLDICKGKLRSIADTEICLYYKKPQGTCQNQLWAARPAASLEWSLFADHPSVSRRSSSHHPTGNVIYSVCNDGWVLDVASSENDSSESQDKLVLFPHHEISSKSQSWEIIAETSATPDDVTAKGSSPVTFHNNIFDSSIANENSLCFSSGSSCTSLESIGFAHGLSPAKRSSQSSINSLGRKSSLGEDYQTLQTYTHYP